MNNHWLFLRGAFDERTDKSLKDDDCVWMQLFQKIGDGVVWFKSDFHHETRHRINQTLAFSKVNTMVRLQKHIEYTHIFARGGFDYYLPILRAYPNAYKIRYGAGKRFMPEPDINYNLILVDTEAQKQAVLQKYPKANVHLFIKPAATHFKPIDCEKEYDVCYIANEQQKAFKGIEWVYKTVPSDLKVLHLGYHDTLNPPPNVTCKRVDRIDMPKWISKCRVGIVPYDSVDSCPRVIPEMMACGLKVVCLNTVNFWEEKYYLPVICDKKTFWEYVILILSDPLLCVRQSTNAEYYKENLSMPVAVKHLKELINE